MTVPHVANRDIAMFVGDTNATFFQDNSCCPFGCEQFKSYHNLELLSSLAPLCTSWTSGTFRPHPPALFVCSQLSKGVQGSPVGQLLPGTYSSLGVSDKLTG